MQLSTGRRNADKDPEHVAGRVERFAPGEKRSGGDVLPRAARWISGCPLTRTWRASGTILASGVPAAQGLTLSGQTLDLPEECGGAFEPPRRAAVVPNKCIAAFGMAMHC